MPCMSRLERHYVGRNLWNGVPSRKNKAVRFPGANFCKLVELVSNAEPYIFARAGTIQAIFQARGLRSQTIRRILFELRDRDDTDWVQAPRPDWIEETKSPVRHQADRKEV